MELQLYNLSDAPCQRVITDVVTKLQSLQDNEGKGIFNAVLPLTQYSYEAVLMQNSPAAFVYFGDEADGFNSANQFDEVYFFPMLEILFLTRIPNFLDEDFPDVQRLMNALHWKVVQNLRIPTDDILSGIPYQKNSTGEVLWEFRTQDDSGLHLAVHHKYNVRTQWIENGAEIKNGDFLHSIRMGVQVNNFNAE